LERCASPSAPLREVKSGDPASYAVAVDLNQYVALFEGAECDQIFAEVLRELGASVRAMRAREVFATSIVDARRCLDELPAGMRRAYPEPICINTTWWRPRHRAHPGNGIL
jgi:hypothetical protein